MPKYGLISETDGKSIEYAIDVICKSLDGTIYPVNVTEVGLYNCATSVGIKEYIASKGRTSNYTGIDNQKDKEIIAPSWMNLIIGNSGEVYNKVRDNSQHIIFLDGNHSYPSVIQDYYCYRNKVAQNGFLIFHDTAPQAQGKDWQRMGSEDDTDMFISVRKALTDLHLISPSQHHPNFVTSWSGQFKFISDTWDENDAAGGTVVMQKVFP